MNFPDMQTGKEVLDAFDESEYGREELTLEQFIDEAITQAYNRGINWGRKEAYDTMAEEE
jgi:hypothetical protein